MAGGRRIKRSCTPGSGTKGHRLATTVAAWSFGGTQGAVRQLRRTWWRDERAARKVPPAYQPHTGNRCSDCRVLSLPMKLPAASAFIGPNRWSGASGSQCARSTISQLSPCRPQSSSKVRSSTVAKTHSRSKHFNWQTFAKPQAPAGLLSGSARYVCITKSSDGDYSAFSVEPAPE